MSNDEPSIRPQRAMIKTDDWKRVAERVKSSGGRVVQIHDESILMVELPDGVTARSVGAEQIDDGQLSTAQRRIAAIWRRVERAPNAFAASQGRFTSWADADSPLSADGPGV